MIFALALGAFAFAQTSEQSEDEKAVAKLEAKVKLLCSELKAVDDRMASVAFYMKKGIENASVDLDTAKHGRSELKKLFGSFAEGAVEPVSGISLAALMGSWEEKVIAVENGRAAYLATEECFEIDEEGCTEFFDEEIETIFKSIDQVAPLLAKYDPGPAPLMLFASNDEQPAIPMLRASNDEMKAQLEKLIAMLDEEMKARIREEDALSRIMLPRVRFVMNNTCPTAFAHLA